MEFGIFNLMGSRDPAKPTVEVFAEVLETKLHSSRSIGQVFVRSGEKWMPNG